MKKLILVLALALIPSFVFAEDIYTKGHWKDTDRDGVKDTYVDPYYKTKSNDTKDDNYSTKGNTNPYTGEKGTYKGNYDYTGSGKKSKSRY